MSDFTKGLWAVHTAVLIFGLTALFSKLITLTSSEITLIRSAFAAIVLLSILLWVKESIRLNCVKHYKTVALLGILLALHWVTYFQAMQVASIAVGVIALFIFPVFTVFLEPLFNGDKPQMRDIIVAFVVFFGIYLIVPEFSLDNNATQGIMWGVLSAFFFSLRNIIQRHHFQMYSARLSLFYQTLIVFIVLLPFSFHVIPEVTVTQWGQLLILGVFFTALPHTLFAFSLLKLKAKTVSLIACVQVVYAISFATLLLNELPDVTTIVGGLIIISAAMIESYSEKKKQH